MLSSLLNMKRCIEILHQNRSDRRGRVGTLKREKLGNKDDSKK